MINIDECCSELYNLLESINKDKDQLRSQRLSLQDKEVLRSSLQERIVYFHKLFYEGCIQIIDDVYLSHTFELASAQTFAIIKIETERELQMFYDKYKYDILPQYFDKVLNQELDDEHYDIVRNNKIDGEYLYLDKYMNTILNKDVMINYISSLIFNH